jgi:hypothetical protein
MRQPRAPLDTPGRSRDEADGRKPVRLVDAIALTETSGASSRHLLLRHLGHCTPDARVGRRHQPAARISGGFCPGESDLWDRDVLVDSTILALERM